MENSKAENNWFSKIYNADIVSLCKFFNIELTREGQEYRGVEHDSLVISPKRNMYSWNSRETRGKGGWSFIKNYVLEDYDNHLSKRQLATKMHAISMQLQANVASFDRATKMPEIKQPYVYPTNHIVDGITQVKNYLQQERKIDNRLVVWLHKNGLLDQDKMDNAVFVERDLFTNKIVGSVLQGTHIDFDKYKKRGTAKFIDKNSEPYSAWHFTIGKPENVKFFESPIDAMSYYQLKKNKDSIYLSMNGLKHEIVSKYLTIIDGLLKSKFNSGIKTVSICVDKDVAGDRFLANELQYQFTNNQGKLIAFKDGQPSVNNCKDWNDVLKNDNQNTQIDKEENKKQNIRKTTISELMNDVQNYFTSPEKFIELVDFLDKFPHYSIKNRLLIKSQRPGAVAVASFKKFKELGYNVKKGEHGVKIFVPAQTTQFKRNDKYISVKYATKIEKEKIKAGEIPTFKKLSFHFGTVFDAQQTNMPKEKYPEIYPNRHIDFDITKPTDQARIDKLLRKYAALIGFTVDDDIGSADFSNTFGNAKGVTAPTVKKIYLNPQNTPTENTTTLMHELGHAQLHSNKSDDTLSRPIQELQAQLTSYLVAKNVGIDNHDYTVDYIANWTNRGKKLSKLDQDIQVTILNNVTSAADKLIDFINEPDKTLNTTKQKNDKKFLSQAQLALAKEQYLNHDRSL